MASLFTDVPEAVRVEARSRLEEITLALQEIPPDSPFWASVQVSQLCLVVRGWSFFYEIEPETLRVTNVRAK
ncbi:MAG: hypothetical protein E6J62_04010 [Deltaproteobacteria bacterium]|nr:MAG: hypothetical protein E6J61_21355 [Deltaproteobacteria bacterium]TMB38065.1 MAG: hypothetical protein E6J62_04010 [Deltaproteobacteria bacterium]